MAEIRITHGVLCKLECTISIHQRRSNLFAGWRYTIRKVFFNVFQFQFVTNPPRRTSVIVLTFVADQVPILEENQYHESMHRKTHRDNKLLLYYK